MNDIKQPQPVEGQKRKRWLEPKDYLTITLSTLAFVVSGGSAYFNILRTDESIHLVHDMVPIVRLTQSQLLVSSQEEGLLGIINSGNRTAVISNINLFYMQPKATQQVSCDFETGSYLETDFEPAALKSSDALIRKIRAAKPIQFTSTNPTIEQTATKDFLLPTAEHNKDAKDILIDVCLYFRISTPSTDFYTVSFPVFRFHAVESRGIFWDPFTEGSLSKLPVVLIRKTGTIFSQ